MLLLLYGTMTPPSRDHEESVIIGDNGSCPNGRATVPNSVFEVIGAPDHSWHPQSNRETAVHAPKHTNPNLVVMVIATARTAGPVARPSAAAAGRATPRAEARRCSRKPSPSPLFPDAGRPKVVLVTPVLQLGFRRRNNSRWGRRGGGWAYVWGRAETGRRQPFRSQVSAVRGLFLEFSWWC